MLPQEKWELAVSLQCFKGVHREALSAVIQDEVRRYLFLADAIPMIIWTARSDGGLDYYNKAWFDYTGLTLGETREWGWRRVIHPDDLERCVDRWTQSFISGENYEIEYRFKRGSDGAYRWFLGRATAMRGEAGEILQWVGTCTDIDDQKRAESALLKHQAELELRVAERTAELAKSNEALQLQHAELRVLFDLMPAMICFKDTQNNILRVNKRIADASGMTVEQIEGKSAHEIYPEGADKYYEADLEIIRTREPKLEQIESIRGADGKDYWMQTDRVPLCDDEGKVIGIVIMSQNITERKKAAAELVESRRFLRSTLDALSAHIAILDEEGKIIEVNEAWHRFTLENSFDGQRSVGTNYLTFCNQTSGSFATEGATMSAGISEIIAGTRAEFHMEYPCHNPTQQRWFLVRATRFAGTGPVRVVVAHANITERKLAEEQVALMHEQLLVASRQSGMAEVASSVLHNAGNVLNSVNVSASLVSEQLRHSRLSGLTKVAEMVDQHPDDFSSFVQNDPRGKALPQYFNLLAEQWQQEQSQACAELMNLTRNIQHIKDIISAQLSLAGVSGLKEPAKIAGVVEVALSMVETSFSERQIKLNLDFTELPATMLDRSKILQILVNLLKNAIEAVQEKRPGDGVVSISTRLNNGQYQISIKDNGVGIRQEDLTRIFAFGYTTKSTGHGFGLHSSALSAQFLGGTLTADSSGLGQGAEFMLTLPVVAVDAKTPVEQIECQ